MCLDTVVQASSRRSGKTMEMNDRMSEVVGHRSKAGCAMVVVIDIGFEEKVVVEENGWSDGQVP